MTKRTKYHLFSIFVWAIILWIGNDMYKYMAVFFIGVSIGVILMDYLEQHRESK